MAETSQNKHTLKKDSYQKRRGTPYFLDIFCSVCNTHIALYQKDGPGVLLRMYLDRILEPLELASLKLGSKEKKDIPGLHCPKCDALIGTPMVYEPESRLAFHMVRGAFFKKRSDGTYPPSVKP